MIKSQIKEFVRNEDGATAVEFAMIAMIFLSVCFAIIEAGRVFWTQNAIQYALESASRERLVDPDLTESEIETAAEDALDSMFVSSVPLLLDVLETTEDDVTYLEMDATYNYTPLISVLIPDNWSTIVLEGRARRPLMWDGVE